MILATALVASLRMSEATTASTGTFVKRFRVGIYTHTHTHTHTHTQTLSSLFSFALSSRAKEEGLLSQNQTLKITSCELELFVIIIRVNISFGYLSRWGFTLFFFFYTMVFCTVKKIVKHSMIVYFFLQIYHHVSGTWGIDW